MNFSQVIVNENYSTSNEIQNIINKPGKLTSEDLDKVCKYFNMTLNELMSKVKKNSKNYKKIKKTPLAPPVPEYSEKIVICLPMSIQPKPKLKPKLKKKSKSPKTPKNKKRKLSYRRLKTIVNKKKISKHETKLLTFQYNIPIKRGLSGVWFAAAKKGHIYVMKTLYKNGHIKDVNITNKNGITAQEIAEGNKRGHIAKWLSSQSIQKVDISKNSGYKIKQTHSDSEDSDESI